MVDFCRSKPSLQPVNIWGLDIEGVLTKRYLGVHLDNKLDWSMNTLYRKVQSQLFFLTRLRSLGSKMLPMFYKSVGASTLFYSAACWGGSMKDKATAAGQAGEKGGWTHWGLWGRDDCGGVRCRPSLAMLVIPSTSSCQVRGAATVDG